MSTRTLIELNHDRASMLEKPEFIEALLRYLRNPEGESGHYHAEILSDYGFIVYGTAHEDSTRTRGFRAPGKEFWFKVIGDDKPMNSDEAPF